LSLAVWLGLGVGAACEDRGEFHEGVVLCEEAVAYLEECCGSLDTHVDCTYVAPTFEETSCHAPVMVDPGRDPDITPEGSECLRALACPEIRKRGYCEEVRDRMSPFGECP
jgi:hypothetical protein